MTELYETGTVTRAPTHPGAILREDVLPALAMLKAEFARNINISRPMLYDILNESRRYCQLNTPSYTIPL